MIRLLCILLLFVLPVKGEETNKEVCVYIVKKEGSTYIIQKQFNDCKEDTNTIIYHNRNEEPA